MNDTKVCCTCGRNLINSEFRIMNGKRQGLFSSCIICEKENQKIYRTENHEKILAARKVFFIENPDKSKEYQQRKYSKNKEKIDKRTREYRKLHPEKVRLYSRIGYLRNRDKIDQRNVTYKSLHPEVVRRMSKTYYDKNRYKILNKAKGVCEDLTDYYIKKHLKDQGFLLESIKQFPEIIEVKRLLIKTKRLCKTLQI